MLLTAEIRKTRVLREVFRLEPGIILVGGCVRDILRGVKPADITDFDLLYKGDLNSLIRRFKACFGGTIVKLKGEQTLRLVLPSGVTIDVSRLSGEVEDDLSERDFTINAIACDGDGNIFDPFKGQNDIKRGVIRKILTNNFKNDPLRLLRAYRFMSELGFRIEKSTRDDIKRLAGLIRQSARERITLEVVNTVNGFWAQKALLYAFKDGLAGQIISLNDNDLEKNIKIVSKLDGFLNKSPKSAVINESIQGLSYIGLLRLEALLISSDFSRNSLVLSSKLLKRARIASQFYGQFLKHLKGMTKGQMFDLFDASKDALEDLLIMSGNIGFITEALRFRRLMEKGILTAEEVMKSTGMTPGPELGRLMRTIRKCQFEGSATTKAQAVKIAKNSAVV